VLQLAEFAPLEVPHGCARQAVPATQSDLALEVFIEA
jgi:hypothetical protein